jgi:hypothetical protein
MDKNTTGESSRAPRELDDSWFGLSALQPSAKLQQRPAEPAFGDPIADAWFVGPASAPR